jgi:hypothetical protein
MARSSCLDSCRRGAMRSSRMASARVRVLTLTITVISMTSRDGLVAMTRCTRGRCPPPNSGISLCRWPRARSDVQGRICRTGRAPASASARSRANCCGHSPGPSPRPIPAALVVGLPGWPPARIRSAQPGCRHSAVAPPTAAKSGAPATISPSKGGPTSGTGTSRKADKSSTSPLHNGSCTGRSAESNAGNYSSWSLHGLIATNCAFFIYAPPDIPSATASQQQAEWDIHLAITS